MPTIRSSEDLRNGYNDISSFCHTCNEPVFITKDGKNLVVMSIASYEALIGRIELYELVREGLDDVAGGNTKPFDDAMADIRARHRR